MVTPLQGQEQPKAADTQAGEVPAASPSDLEALKAEALLCTACTLSQTRTQVVFGVGNPHADIVFIGEAPGREEDIKGEPFVGRAGKLLDRMLYALGFDRSRIYIMNVIKCRPPGNRDPKPDEVAACSHWFDSQWESIEPKVICLLGRVAAQRVLDTDVPLASLRGRWHEYRDVPVWVTYHPAYLLRSPSQKAKAWDDMIQLKQRYQSLMAASKGVSVSAEKASYSATS